MLVRITPLRYGLSAEPVAQKWKSRFAQHMYRACGTTNCIIFSTDEDVPEDIRNNAQWPELMKGWSIVVRMHPYDYGNWLGYDARIVA